MAALNGRAQAYRTVAADIRLILHGAVPERYAFEELARDIVATQPGESVQSDSSGDEHA